MSHYNNTSLVEDSLKLVSSSSGPAASTVINYGLWYGICKTTGLVATLSGRYDLSVTDQNELQEVKSSFCNQLAAVITSTEVALAGRVSPWPLETPWWQPMRFVGTAYSAYEAYTHRDPYLIPIRTTAYFTHEVVARTVATATAVGGLRYQNESTIAPFDYARAEYNILSFIAGMMVGTIVHEKMIARGFSPGKAAFGHIVSSVLTDGILLISYLLKQISDDDIRVETATAAEVLAGTGTIAGSWATAVVGAVDSAQSPNSLFSGQFAVPMFVAMRLTPARTELWSVVGMITGSIAGSGVMYLLWQQHSKLDSNHLLNNVALTLAPALALALINGFSDNAVYGYSLEESFTETTRNQWKKFHAPLDYLYTLFN
ncbi:hypothetical protein [Endozoicomonas sp. ISHI1]|uniref:hypothetical protein n=1 Tax=Endozoicomonas sp. ISHI1 TaxID=2825882 RepID=UPI002148E71F|nr:hypothetical protein [Endozoicomonas sp. ISHI1]